MTACMYVTMYNIVIVYISGLDIKLMYPLAPWLPKKVTGQNIVNKICCYRGAHRFRRPSFDRSDIMNTF